VISLIICQSGPHKELIKDPEGPYSQLVQLQERANQKEAVVEPQIYAMSTLGSQRSSMSKSVTIDHQ